MQSPPFPLTRDVVLIGGGHTHALVLRKWGMNPLPGARLTVINPGPVAPYSGMLPGHIAGHYSREALEIDLLRLGRFANARVVLDRAVGIDRAQRRILLHSGAALGYDLASFDIGITARMEGLPGFAEHATGVKPLDDYAARWGGFLADVTAGRSAASVAVIGGGVAGVELALAMAHALRASGIDPQVTVIEAGPGISGVPPATAQRLRRALDDHGVQLLTASPVAEVTDQGVVLQSGAGIAAALVVGAAGAWPHRWLRDTDLPLQDGFIRVGPTLQLADDPSLFAVGDCAHLEFAPRPKAGVFAVRAAPVLFDNLRAALTGRKLRPFRPQRDYLKLMSLGGKVAMAEKFGITLSGPALWRLKDRIDQRFMRAFAELPAMAAPRLPADHAAGLGAMLADRPLCGGCGAKLGGDVLQQALSRLTHTPRADVLTGPGDDAAVLRIGGQYQVITTDHLRGFTLDPALLARIAALHALGDIWAMGARPQAALATIILPQMAPALQQRTLDEVMAAAAAVFNAEGAAIVGGHSTLGAELTVGFTITGLSDRPPVSQGGARPGDALILTRPLGSGVILAAEMAGLADGRHVAALWSEMSRPQSAEAGLLRAAHAMTDVTGFGLAGHLMAICRASGVGAVLDLAAIPAYDGALEMIRQGQRSSLHQSNQSVAPISGAGSGDDDPRLALLSDPQTAGGFLAAVPGDQAQALLADLRAGGATQAAVIGQLHEGPAAITLGPA